MKILTILIFSGDRVSINELLNDISKINQSNLNIRLIDWGENKKILKKKKKIYSHFQKKLKNFKIYYQKGNWEVRYLRYMKKFNSKYTLLIGDDDRLNINTFPKIFKYLNFDFSGITLSFNNYQNNKDLKKKELGSSDLIRPFNIYNDINEIGFVSCQIIKTDLINQISAGKEKNLLRTDFIQNFIILKIIKKFKKWKVTSLKCIYRRMGDLDTFHKPEQYLGRLKSEYSGYLIPLKKNFKHLKSSKIKKIYKTIFFKNIISWLFLAIVNCGKKKTFENINEMRKIIDEPYIVKMTLIIFYICPIFLLNFLRILRRVLIK
jgi:hypothetical protein